MSAQHWSSRTAFYLVTVGAAVGLGSIWRFPYLAGSSGGSAFVFVFLLACLMIAVPLLVAEFLLGRWSRRSPPQAAGEIAAEKVVRGADEELQTASPDAGAPARGSTAPAPTAADVPTPSGWENRAAALERAAPVARGEPGRAPAPSASTRLASARPSQGR